MYRQNRSRSFFRPAVLISACLICAMWGSFLSGCQHKMSAEEEQKAVDTFKGGPRPADSEQVMAKERANAEAYRKAHPEKFPTNLVK